MNAADKLDAIRTGAGYMVMNAHQRLAECKEALEHGDFESALEACSALSDRLSNLAFAESRLAALANASLIRVPELEEGMASQGGGRITSIEPCDCGLQGCDKVMVTFENGAVQKMERAWEMLVVDEPRGA